MLCHYSSPILFLHARQKWFFHTSAPGALLSFSINPKLTFCYCCVRLVNDFKCCAHSLYVICLLV